MTWRRRGVELPDLGEQFPGHLDGALLEVIAEGPVAEHFEEGVVAAGAADVVEVVVLAAGADALLGVGDALPGGLGGAEEVGLELVHAGVGEQQRGVVLRHDRRGGEEGVAVVLDEEVDELPADFGGGDRGRGRGSWTRDSWKRVEPVIVADYAVQGGAR